MVNVDRADESCMWMKYGMRVVMSRFDPEYANWLFVILEDDSLDNIVKSVIYIVFRDK